MSDDENNKVIQKTIRELAPNQRVAIRARAISKLGVYSDWSDALEVTTPGDSSIPGPPEDLEIDFDTPDLVLAWDDATENVDGTRIQDFSHYEIQFHTLEGSQTVETVNTEYVYPFRRNERHFGEAQPDIDIEIRTVDVSGNLSGPLTGRANNPEPSTPEDPPDLNAAFSIVNISARAHPDDDDIVQYHFEWRPSGSSTWQLIGSSDGGTLSHEVDVGSENYYRFYVEDAFGRESDPSPEESVTTRTVDVDPTPPDNPEDLQIVDVGFDDGEAYIDLEWSPNQEEDLARYEVQYTADAILQPITSLAPGKTDYTLENLDPGVSYEIVLYAVDESGLRSGPSNAESATTPEDDTPPPTPEGLEAQGGIESISVSWEGVATSGLDYYELHGSTQSSFFPDDDNLLYSGTNTSFVHFTDGAETWHFRLRAVGTNEETSDYTDEKSGTSKASFDVPDEPPDTPEVVSIGTGQDTIDQVETVYVEIEWGEVSDVSGYSVRFRRSDGDYSYDYRNVSSDSTSLYVTSVSPGVEYEFQVAAFDSFGDYSEYSDAELITTHVDDKPPASPTITDVTPMIRSIIVQWEANTEPDFAKYEIQIAESGQDFHTYTEPSGGTIESITRYYDDSDGWVDLVPGDEYEVRMRAVDRASNASDWSDVQSAEAGQASDDDIEALAVDKLISGELTAVVALLGTIKTADSGARIEIDSEGITAYGTDGSTKKLEFDTDTGELSVLGAVESGSTITGSDIVGGEIRTNDNATQDGIVINDEDGIRVFEGGSLTAYISRNGEAFFGQSVKINPSDMSDDDEVIQTPNTILKADGNLITSALIANEGQIAGTSITQVDGQPALEGGLISGAEYHITSGGQVKFKSDGTLEWDDGAQGGIIVSNDGFIESTNYVPGEQGFRFDSSVAELNDVILSADDLQVGISTENLLRDSAFVEGDDFNAWEFESDEGHNAEFDDSSGLYFQSCLRMVSTGGSNSMSVRQSLSVDDSESWLVQPLESYTAVSVWVYPLQPTEADARVELLDDGYSEIEVGQYQELASETWNRVSLLANLDDEYDHVYFSLRIGRAGEVDDSEEFRVDGASLTRASYLTDYNPAPLELPRNYISDAFISDLSVSKLTGGIISGQEFELQSDGSITGDTFEISGDGATFQDGSISLIGAGGALTLDTDSLRLNAGGEVQFKVDEDGVFMGGSDANSASFYYDTDAQKAVFQASESGYNFSIDPGDEKVLRLQDGSDNDSFYLTDDGKAYFRQGAIDIGGGQGFHVDTQGNMWAGAESLANAPFAILVDGDVEVRTSEIVLGDNSDSVIRSGALDGGSPKWEIRGDGSAFFGGDVDIEGVLTAGDVGDNGTTVISGDRITTGTIDASGVSVTNLNANNISVGTLDANRVETLSLRAGDIEIENAEITNAMIDDLDVNKLNTNQLVIEPDEIAFRNQSWQSPVAYIDLSSNEFRIRHADGGSGSLDYVGLNISSIGAAWLSGDGASLSVGTTTATLNAQARVQVNDTDFLVSGRSFDDTQFGDDVEFSQDIEFSSSTTLNVVNNSDTTVENSNGREIISWRDSDINGDHRVRSDAIRSATAGTNANVFVNSNDNLGRETSSIRYKTDVEDIDMSMVREAVDQMRPVWYRSTSSMDRPDWSHYGFIAEEVAEIDPRLVDWEHKDAEYGAGEWYNFHEIDPPDHCLVPGGIQKTKILSLLTAYVQDLSRQVKELQAERER